MHQMKCLNYKKNFIKSKKNFYYKICISISIYKISFWAPLYSCGFRFFWTLFWCRIRDLNSRFNEKISVDKKSFRNIDFREKAVFQNFLSKQDVLLGAELLGHPEEKISKYEKAVKSFCGLFCIWTRVLGMLNWIPKGEQQHFYKLNFFFCKFFLSFFMTLNFDWKVPRLKLKKHKDIKNDVFL